MKKRIPSLLQWIGEVFLYSIAVVFILFTAAAVGELYFLLPERFGGWVYVIYVVLGITLRNIVREVKKKN